MTGDPLRHDLTELAGEAAAPTPGTGVGGTYLGRKPPAPWLGSCVGCATSQHAPRPSASHALHHATLITCTRHPRPHPAAYVLSAQAWTFWAAPRGPSSKPRTRRPACLVPPAPGSWSTGALTRRLLLPGPAVDHGAAASWRRVGCPDWGCRGRQAEGTPAGRHPGCVGRVTAPRLPPPAMWHAQVHWGHPGSHYGHGRPRPDPHSVSQLPPVCLCWHGAGRVHAALAAARGVCVGQQAAGQLLAGWGWGALPGRAATGRGCPLKGTAG